MYLIESNTQNTVLMIANDTTTRGNLFLKKVTYEVCASLAAYLNPETNKNIGTAGDTIFANVRSSTLADI
jgi:hypothetical protein